MNFLSRTRTSADEAVEAFRRVRAAMPALAKGLSAEDLSAQSMADCSPGMIRMLAGPDRRLNG